MTDTEAIAALRETGLLITLAHVLYEDATRNTRARPDVTQLSEALARLRFACEDLERLLYYFNWQRAAEKPAAKEEPRLSLSA